MIRRILCASAALAFVGSPALAQVNEPIGRAAFYLSTNQYVSPKSLGIGGVGDCVHDDYGALVRAANRAVLLGLPLWTGDGCYAFGSAFVTPAGLVWRSDYSEAHRLLWIGGTSLDPIEVNNTAIDVDGIVLDLNRSGSAVRTSGPALHTGFGIHGSMTVPSYLAGVRIGRLRVEHGADAAGVELVNLTGPVLGTIEVNDNWGAAIGVTGVIHARWSELKWQDVGNLSSEGARIGQGLAYFAETDPQKKPAAWYFIANRDSPSANILPSFDNELGTVYGILNTDTGVYAHDYLGGAGVSQGCLRTGTVNLSYVGKDAIKEREGATCLTIGDAILKEIGNRYVVLDEHASNLTIGTIHGDKSGVDALGDYFGTPMPFTGGDGTGQTLTTSPGGIICDLYSTNMKIGAGAVSNIHSSPVDASQGHGLYTEDCGSVFVHVNLDTTDGNGVRVSSSTNVDIAGVNKNAVRSTSIPMFNYINNDTANLGAQTGTITTTTSSSAVTGTGTAFTTTIGPNGYGQYIWVGPTNLGQVIRVTDDTHAVLAANAAANETAQAYSISNALGTLTSSTGSSTVTGVGTSFESDVVEGQSIYGADHARICRIFQIVSNTSLTCSSDTAWVAANALANETASLYYPQESANVRLNTTFVETSGLPVAQKASKITGFPTNFDVHYAAQPHDFSDSLNAANGTVMSSVPSTALLIRHDPIQFSEGSAAITTDSSGHPTVATPHNLYTTPRLDYCQISSLTGWNCHAAPDGTNYNFVIYSASGAAANAQSFTLQFKSHAELSGGY